ncbi:GGDEF domain-containing protein [Treponema primitia]|uniref:GGDEF domain-containing protein n=1 Tax=Treponema primitia TaxID=88058 RepID=UPI00025553F7|nr:GGDEF domain-containing protein [Treponema primitia]
MSDQTSGNNGELVPFFADPVLINSPLFSSLSDLEFNAVTTFLERRPIKRGAVIFNEGDAGEEMFVLLSGDLSAFVAQSDGTPRYMFSIPPGDFFGEMSIIANEPRSATISAKEDSELVVLQALDFYRIIYMHPMIGVKMLFAIAGVQNIWLDRTAQHLRDLMSWGETARRRAITDDLTGLYNRRFLDNSIKERIKNGSLELRKMSLMVMDLDNIHEINDRYGSHAVDRILVTVADVIRGIMRTGDICARLDGDEFAILLPDVNVEVAKSIAERVRELVSIQKIIVASSEESREPVTLSIHTSIGIAEAPTRLEAEDEIKVIDRALAALRKAKEGGKNRVEVG